MLTRAPSVATRPAHCLLSYALSITQHPLDKRCKNAVSQNKKYTLHVATWWRVDNMSVYTDEPAMWRTPRQAFWRHESTGPLVHVW